MEVKTFTGASLTTDSFSYSASEGDGNYSFYSIATDNAGNAQTTPSTPDTTTLLDTTAPTSSASSPAYSKTTTFTVSYTANDSGSGLAEVDIYAEGPTDSGYSLADSFTGASLTTGSFSYSASEGDGNYSFYSIATDNAGNAQTTPGNPDTTTLLDTAGLLDTAAPTSSASSPAYSKTTTFTVSYTANDPGVYASGVAEVDIYAEGPTASGYSLADSFTGASLTTGSFSYSASEGDGNYSFYSIATDNAGNAQTTPGTPDTTTLLDTAMPTSSASSPQYSKTTTFTVSYTANDSGSGLAEVDIYAEGPTDSGYSLADSFTGASLTTGSLSYSASEGDGNYSFYSIATDNAGNAQTTPGNPDTTTLLDTAAPTSSASSPAIQQDNHLHGQLHRQR